MPGEFQTTFIPKKPTTDMPQSSGSPTVRPKRSKSLGILSMLSILVFVVALLISGGVVVYERLLIGRVETMRTTLTAAQDRIEPAFIVELQDLDTRLRVSNQLLAEHVGLAPFFDLLENLTLKSVQFETFDFTFEAGQPVITMSGLARRYQSIAEQSNLLGSSPLVKNHIFSNFSLTQDGRVSFDLMIMPASELIYFEQSLRSVPQQSNVILQRTSSVPVTTTTSTSSEATTEAADTVETSASVTPVSNITN